jgi:sugar/nucleoside kinase (ribokinase family)
MKSIIGIGLVALDIVLEKSIDTKPLLYAGGSCGNVLSILSYLGYETYPIARLANNKATKEILHDFEYFGVKTDLIFKGSDGSTPIIIQRNSKSKDGLPIHRFEFRNPENGKYLPSFKPVLAKTIDFFYDKKSKCDFFYLDRISRSSIELAKLYKENGAIIIFEPSSLKIDNKALINELIEFVDILKFSSDRIPNYKAFFEQGVIPLEIETLGVNGINYRINKSFEGTDNKWKHISSFNLSSIIDSSGAGDWTSAGIIKGLIENNINSINEVTIEKIESILKYAQTLGSLSCLFKGARGLMYQINENLLDHLSEELLTNSFSEKKLIDNVLINDSHNLEDTISSLLTT